MATATATRSLGKTGFVKEFLNDHPQANASALNEAWKEAGFEGTISNTLVTRMRSELGLTGNIPKGSGKKAGATTGTASAPVIKKRGRRKGATGRRRGGNQGKSAFVVQHLKRNPEVTDDEINEGWVSAGNEGGISGSLISKIKAKEGLTKKRGSKRRRRAKSSLRTAASDRTAEMASQTPKPIDGRSSRGRSIAEVEADIDRLIFKLIALGGMETIEDELRKVRRLLYRSYSV